MVNSLDIAILPYAWQVRSVSIRIDTPIAVIDFQVATGFVRDVAAIVIFVNVESIDARTAEGSPVDPTRIGTAEQLAEQLDASLELVVALLAEERA